jgi:hypothetical protein
MLSLIPDQGGCKMRLRYWLPRAGKRCTVPQYTAIIRKAKYQSFLFISPMPGSEPTTSPNGFRLESNEHGTRRRSWKQSSKWSKTSNPRQPMSSPCVQGARRFAKKANKQSWIISKLR